MRRRIERKVGMTGEEGRRDDREERGVLERNREGYGSEKERV